jgi:hypothetical protein
MAIPGEATARRKDRQVGLVTVALATAGDRVTVVQVPGEILVTAGRITGDLPTVVRAVGRHQAVGTLVIVRRHRVEVLVAVVHQVRTEVRAVVVVVATAAVEAEDTTDIARLLL